MRSLVVSCMSPDLTKKPATLAHRDDGQGRGSLFWLRAVLTPFVPLDIHAHVSQRPSAPQAMLQRPGAGASVSDKRRGNELRQKSMFPGGSLKTWGSLPSVKGLGTVAWGREDQTSVAAGWTLGSGSPGAWNGFVWIWGQTQPE